MKYYARDIWPDLIWLINNWKLSSFCREKIYFISKELSAELSNVYRNFLSNRGPGVTVYPSLMVRFGICRTSWYSQLLPDMTADVLFPPAFKSFGWLHRNFHKIFLHILGKVPNRADSMQKWLTERQYANLWLLGWTFTLAIQYILPMEISTAIWLLICKYGCQYANMTPNLKMLLSMCKFGCHCANMTVTSWIYRYWMTVGM
jgi:hypothetical protein